MSKREGDKMVQKQNKISLIQIMVSLIIIASHFIPWMKYSYSIPGMDE